MTFPPRCFAGCKTIADRIRRLRMEREKTEAQGQSWKQELQNTRR